MMTAGCEKLCACGENIQRGTFTITGCVRKHEKLCACGENIQQGMFQENTRLKTKILCEKKYFFGENINMQTFKGKFSQ